MQHHVDANGGGSASTPLEHVPGRVESFHLEATPTKFEQRITVAAPEFECGLTRAFDEPCTGICVRVGRSQRGVQLRHEAGVEERWFD
jgi:hypothetical protein